MRYMIEDKNTGKLRIFLELPTAVALCTGWVFEHGQGNGRLIRLGDTL